MPLFESVDNLQRDADVLRRRPYGVICMENGGLREVRLRPWPKLISVAEIAWWGRGVHERLSGDRCWLYYNQPRRHRSFLALKYIISSHQATFQTFRRSLMVLDEIARLKQTDAIVCEVRNLRISDRLLRRWGWESHLSQSRQRHFIKRFYGSYPSPDEVWTFASSSH